MSPDQKQWFSRENPRWNGVNYRGAGAYHVTIATYGRRRLLGKVVDGRMVRSAVGEMVAREWERLPETYPFVSMDTLMVMPDHLHGILHVHVERGCARAPRSLSQIVGQFKARTTRRYDEGVSADGWPERAARLWQRSFFDRAIRDQDELERTREYILRNPERWWRQRK